jgi:Zn-dependent alcohol dehydrogenase
MVISVLGKMAAKAAIKKITSAGIKKARPVEIGGDQASLAKAAELFKKMGKTMGVLPPAAKEKLKEGTLSKKTIRTIMKKQFGTFVKQKVKAETLRCFKILKTIKTKRWWNGD